MFETYKSYWLIAMLGARMHYAVPVIMYRANILAKFYTDFVLTNRLYYINFLSKYNIPFFLKKGIARTINEIPCTYIKSFPIFAASFYFAKKNIRNQINQLMVFLKYNKVFCKLVCKSNWKNIDAVYTYNTAGLEILQKAKKIGLYTCSEQTIAPYNFEKKIISEERKNFPDWEEFAALTSVEQIFIEREQEEWQYSDSILCGSEFVKNTLVESGVPSNKCHVIPYGVSLNYASYTRERIKRKLRVLSVGAVGLRKGSPYVVQAAREMQGYAEFRWVGSTAGINPKVFENISNNLVFTGSVCRKDIYDHYNWADVFVLPSLCEGSATAVYEALSSGLPVICTPNTGSVVRDGIEGYIIPIRDYKSLVERISWLLIDDNLRYRMSVSAIARAHEYDLSSYSRRLLDFFKK